MANLPEDSRLPVAIVGASGYSGELLLSLLLRHPNVRVALVASRQHAGKPVEEVIPSVRGLAPDLRFTASEPEALAATHDVELFYLALPHGVAATFAAPLVAAGKRVIDLSADFRLGFPDLYEAYYGQKHPHPDLLARSPYVLPELTDLSWKESFLIAAPGCYPTSVLLPLIPLLKKGLLTGDGIIVNSFSGVSGAGRKATEGLLYCERAESAKAYGMPRHRHLSEIEEQLSDARGEPVTVQFTPHLAPMRRGIITTIVAASNGRSLDEVYDCWREVFEDRPFVYLLPSGQAPDSQYVVGSNRLDMSAVLDERTGNFVITSAEDNLMKGAGGQGIQIMNLWYGFAEDAGLL